MSFPSEFTRVGALQKPYGLLGEVKVRPESFDFDRYKKLERVFARNRAGEIAELVVRAARADGESWYLKFEGRRTPESVSELSGRELLVDAAEKLALPEGMVYFSEVPGMEAVGEDGERVGEISEVRESGAGEYLVIKTATSEIPVPWNDHFVTRIDREARRVHFDLSPLRGVLL